MALNRKLSDKPLASTYTADARVHIYEPNDFSQSPTGSDYQLPIENIEFTATDENAVHKTGDESASGIKTWQDLGIFEGDIKLKYGADFSRLRYSLGTGLEFYENLDLVFGIGGDGEFYYNFNDYAGRLNFTELTDSRIYTMPDETGTLATREWVDIQISGIGGTGSVLATKITTTSANLNRQDVAGFLGYVNFVTPFSIASNEIVEYHITDTGQIFKILVNNRSIGSGQVPLISSEILELGQINWSRIFPFEYGYKATGLALTAYGSNAITETGTGTNLLNGALSYRRLRSAGTSGATCNISDAAFVRIGQNKGYFYELRVKSADASTISDVRFLYGLGDSGAIPNINPSAIVGRSFIGLSADGADTNCQLTYADLGGAYQKINLGSNFPKDGTSEYLIRLYRMPSSSNTVYYVKNINNGQETTGVVQNNPSAGLNVNVNRNNNTTATACGFEVQRAVVYVSD
jgi:hypothetical protein